MSERPNDSRFSMFYVHFRWLYEEWFKRNISYREIVALSPIVVFQSWKIKLIHMICDEQILLSKFTNQLLFKKTFQIYCV